MAGTIPAEFSEVDKWAEDLTNILAVGERKSGNINKQGAFVREKFRKAVERRQTLLRAFMKAAPLTKDDADAYKSGWPNRRANIQEGDRVLKQTDMAILLGLSSPLSVTNIFDCLQAALQHNKKLGEYEFIQQPRTVVPGGSPRGEIVMIMRPKPKP